MQTGLDRLAAGFDEGLADRRVALLADHTAIDMWGRHAVQVLGGLRGTRVVRLLAAPHGVLGEGPEVFDRDPVFGLPVVPVMGAGLTAASFGEADAVVCDLRDIGARATTTHATLARVMAAAAEARLPVWVLDRPNPLGVKREGPCLRRGFESDRGTAGLPMRHGATIGQIARWMAPQVAPEVDLRIVRCDHHARISYVPPVPEVPSLDAAVLFPGMNLLEATTLSVGHGTTTPYLLLGAPGLSPIDLVDLLRKRDNPGLDFVPRLFRPQSGAHAGELCGGVYARVYDRSVVSAVATSLYVLHAVRALAPAAFAWRDADFGGPAGVPAIDLLWGGEDLRRTLDKGQDVDKLLEQASAEAHAWKPDAD